MPTSGTRAASVANQLTNGRVRLVHVDHVVAAAAELPAEGGHRLGRDREVGDRAVGRDAHGSPERHQVIGQGPSIRLSAAMHDTRKAVVGVDMGPGAERHAPGPTAPRRGPPRAGRHHLDTCTSTGKRALRARRHGRASGGCAKLRASGGRRNFLKLTFIRVLPGVAPAQPRRARRGTSASSRPPAGASPTTTSCAPTRSSEPAATATSWSARWPPRSTRSTSCTCCSTRAG